MSPTHWLIVIGVLVLLFGAKKLPDMARSIGQSTRVFKGEMKGLREDDSTEENAGGPAPADATPPAGPTPPAGAIPQAGAAPPVEPGLGQATEKSTG